MCTLFLNGADLLLLSTRSGTPSPPTPSTRSRSPEHQPPTATPPLGALGELGSCRAVHCSVHGSCSAALALTAWFARFLAHVAQQAVHPPTPPPHLPRSLGSPTITSASMASNVLSVLITPPSSTGGSGTAAAAAFQALACLPARLHPCVEPAQQAMPAPYLTPPDTSALPPFCVAAIVSYRVVAVPVGGGANITTSAAGTTVGSQVGLVVAGSLPLC